MRLSRVELFENIRRDRRLDPLVSQRALAAKYGVHRRTIRQAIASAISPPRKAVRRKFRVLDPAAEWIDAMLREDLKAPRNRSTPSSGSRSAWRRSTTSTGFRRHLDGMVPQAHLPGEEAEVDFADVWFMQGHAEAFRVLGGVPTRHVRYDNLKPAVRQVCTGRNRVESERWITFRSHYGFGAFYCVPGQEGAHEKGGVEQEGGRFRRSRLVPVPDVALLEELNTRLTVIDEAEDERMLRGKLTDIAATALNERASYKTSWPTYCGYRRGAPRSRHLLILVFRSPGPSPVQLSVVGGDVDHCLDPGRDCDLDRTNRLSAVQAADHRARAASILRTDPGGGGVGS
ncbi:hypothetical protein ACIHFC_35100 [Streptomyces sp. NPDC052013]|uniref:hypothetical protein n=1 Tax=Streptomyces sp. NPDC052013 TaxID=3365679 RepID=UPI0037D3D433